MPSRTYRFDLHLHSCLSPCAELEMSPRAIAQMAQGLGLDALALTDHQSTQNCPAFAACCADVGIVPWFGLEMCTAEETHVLALFDDLDGAMAFGESFVRTLPVIENRWDAYGPQAIVDAYDNVLGFEKRMLSIASRLDLGSAVAAARSAGALVVASHVDRASFSVPSQLGFLTGDEGFDAVELSVRAPWDHAPDGLSLAGYPVLRNSDSHAPWQMGTQWNEAELERFGVAEVREALREGRVRHARREGGA
jgi:hypothetical protein